VEIHTSDSDTPRSEPSAEGQATTAGRRPPWIAIAIGLSSGLVLIVVGGRVGNATHLGKLLQFLGKLSIAAIIGGSVVHSLLLGRLGAERVLRLYFRLVTIGLSLSVALLVGEFALRIVYRDITTTSDFTSWFTSRWLRHSPPQQNSLGFREREITAQPPPGVYRIAFIGDSFAYGQGIAEVDRMSNVLEIELNAQGGAYEVLNFGVPGAETKEQLVTLRDVVHPLQPHAVVQQWFTNDIHDNTAWRQPRPIRLIPSDFVSGVLHRHSALYYLANNQWRTWQYSHGIMPPAHEQDVARYSDPDGPAWRAARQRQIEFIETCTENQIQLCVVLFPQLVDSLGPEYPLNFLLDRMVALLEEKKVGFVDLRAAFSHTQPISDLWVKQLDWHPNARANRIAVGALVDVQASAWETDRRQRVQRQ